MVGRQTPFLALIVPLILVVMVDGRRGIRQTWPVGVVGGFSFAIGQFVCSNYISVELTDIVASLLATARIVGFLRVWQPGEPLLAEGDGRFAAPGRRRRVRRQTPRWRREIARRDDTHGLAGRRPARLRAVPDHHRGVRARADRGRSRTSSPSAVRRCSSGRAWTSRNANGKALSRSTFKLQLAARPPGTLLLICGLLTMAVLRVSRRARSRPTGRRSTSSSGRSSPSRPCSALAYVMNQSGQTITIGLWAAGAGGIFAFLSPMIGWLGSAVTGSDTSSNSLFGALQVAAAQGRRHLDPMLLAAANSSGGVLGKMISPQNLAIGAAAVGMAGQEGDLFRKVLEWSLLLMLADVRASSYLQSTGVLVDGRLAAVA